MDGNGRWAKKRMLPRAMGHKRGVETVRKIVRAAGELGLEALSLYAFSSENWTNEPKPHALASTPATPKEKTLLAFLILRAPDFF